MTTAEWERTINDRDAYGRLYAEYFRKFYNYGRKFTDNTSLIEDSAQEVFLDIWTNRQKLLQVRHLNSYFFSSFRFILVRQIKEAQKTTSPGFIDGDPEFSIDHIIVDREENLELEKKLTAALKTLTPHQREALFLRFYQTLSYDEIAEVLGITVKAAYKIMARSLSALKKNIVIPASLLYALLAAKNLF